MPDGWERYQPDQISGVSHGKLQSESVPLEYRNIVKKKPSFSYTLTISPGVYVVRLGAADGGGGCVTGKRVFQYVVNGKKTDDIDIFSRATCNSPFNIDVGPITVGLDGSITVSAIHISGWAPVLANLQVFDSGSLPSPSPSPDSPQPMQFSTKVSFPKYGAAPGWTKYDVSKLEAGTSIGRGSPTVTQKEFRSHAKKAEGFYYLHNADPGIYNVVLGFLESSNYICKNGNKRVFKAEVNSKATSEIDVQKAVGCFEPYYIVVHGVHVSENRELKIELRPEDGAAPFLANFEVIAADPNAPASPSPSSSPSPDSPSTDVHIEVNAGVKDEPNAPTTTSKTFFHGQGIKVPSNALGTTKIYKSSRYGLNFAYKFHLAPGSYDVVLGFIESFKNHCALPGKRVFNVLVNGFVELESLDIYKEVGCYHALEKTLPHVVLPTNPQPLVIQFQAISNNAQVSFIRITAAKNQCVPEFNGVLKADHAAHAVPGSYPPQGDANSPTSYVDSDGTGFVSVRIDGSRSHTHFFDSANNIVGRITSHIWTFPETGVVLSRKEAFTHDFPLGTTRLKLAVVDSVCTTHEAETTVTVTGKVQPGAYCYYYTASGSMPAGGNLLGTPRPDFAAISYSLSFGFPQFSFDSEAFSARCHFFFENDVDSQDSEISVDVEGTGTAKVYKGIDLILDTSTITSATTALPKGMTFFELVYQRAGDLSVAPRLSFKVDGSVPADERIKYDQSDVVPILSGVDPTDGTSAGGTTVKITGFGLFQPLTVNFGGKEVAVLGSGATAIQFFVKSPASDTKQVVDITAISGRGLESNVVNFDYGSTCDSIGFEEAEMVKRTIDASGADQESPIDFINIPTCATLGQDGKIYLGTLGATVQVLGYDSDTLVATSHCYSEALVDNRFLEGTKPAVRDILGIAFNPSDKEILPYVSTSTLYWLEKETINLNNKGAWRNGAVDRLKVVTGGTTDMEIENAGVCLVHDKRIVSNLPVSNHDHAVNGILFTQNGDLLITVGGFTNSGLPGLKLGGIWETQLSAAVLLAKTSLGAAFDGDIKYSNEDTLHEAKVISGDVSVFASGLRNAFTLAMKRSGDLYTTDQGPNCKFGDTASSCDEYDLEVTETWDPVKEDIWPGRIKHGWKACPYGPGRKDKVVHLTAGNYYGHANLQRGEEGECMWIDPYTDKTADNKDAPATYKGALATLTSAVTGIAEYGANHFCGALRGDLIISSYKKKPTYRMSVDGDKKLKGPDELWPSGGLSFVEDAHGNLIFPRYAGQQDVYVLKPKVSAKAKVFVAGAVPVRHGEKGGTLVTVGGGHFGTVPKVYVGDKECVIVSKKMEREIVCAVPSGEAGSLADVKVVTESGDESVLPDGVLYMKV